MIKLALKISLVLTLFVSHNTSFGQKIDITNEEYLEYFKVLCYNDLSQFSVYFETEDYLKLLPHSSKIFKADTLITGGLKDIYFIKISVDTSFDIQHLYDSLEKSGSHIRFEQNLFGGKYFVYPGIMPEEIKEPYIFCYSSGSVYKVSGFRVKNNCGLTNLFYGSRTIYLNEELNQLPPHKLKLKTILKTVSVEEVDLESIFESCMDEIKRSN